MRAFTTAALAAAACLAGTQALATPTHLSDAQYIEASRCVGLMSSKTLGTSDAAAMRQLVHDQVSGRMAFVYDRADQARDDAERDANRTGVAAANLVAERDGVCHALLAGGGGAGHAAARSPS